MLNLTKILDVWESNPQFREEFKNNHMEALKHFGFDVNEDEATRVASLFRHQSAHDKDEPLDPRISK